MAQVNPNTVQRAYREMEQADITETLRGQGTFISDRPGLVQEIRDDMARQALGSFVREMHSLGYTEEQTIQQVRTAYRELAEGGGDDGEG